MFNKRISQVFELLNGKSIDALLISTGVNINYLIGFEGVSESEHEVWLLFASGKVYLFTDGRYYDGVKNLKGKIKNLETRLITLDKKLSVLISEILQDYRIQKLHFEQEGLTYLEYSKLEESLTKIELLAIESPVSYLRTIKDENEIEKLREACRLTDQFYHEFTSLLTVGKTESELVWALEVMVRNKGFELSFPPIVAVDENSSLPHHNSKHSQKKISSDSLILIDFGVKFEGYCADMTRMYFVAPVKGEVQNIYNKLLKIQQETVAKVKENIKTAEIDFFCRNQITKNFNLPLPHALGHGVGLQIHEAPSLSPVSKESLKAGMAITIEPGVYFSGRWGMRIEDTILVTEKGVEILTKCKK